MNVLFFGSLLLYFAAAVLQFIGTLFKKDKVAKIAWLIFLAGLAAQTAYLLVRGVTARRLPLSNQFEFATAFAWGIALMLLIVRLRLKADWLSVAVMPMVFLVLSYAALQPREVTELMPALRSAWFGFHIGSAVFSYSAFIIAGCVGLRYLIVSKKGSADELKLHQMDYLSYRMIALGFLLLTVTILSGALWAEQAWSAFWTWDPKEVWALITWIIYALFTFAGVNTIMPGLHSYG